MCVVLYACAWNAASAACTGSSPTWTSTADRTSVNTCVSNASAEDTIHVQAGTVTWSSGITIVKTLNIIGGNGGTTTINLTGGNFVLLRAATSGQNASSIGYFTINQTSSSETFRVDSDGGSTPQGWRIHHITRNVSGNAAPEFVNGWGNCAKSWKGLVDNNILTNGRVVFYGEELSTGGGCRWAEPLNLGNDDAVYIEDNYFIQTSPSATSFLNNVDGNAGARIVARFNTFSGGRIESHGVQSEGQRGVKRWEFYYNSLTSNPADKQYRPFLIRGGSGMAFKNTSDGNFIVNQLMIDNLRSHQADVYEGMPNWGACDGSSPADEDLPGGEGYACRDQIGVGQDAFLWNYSGEGPTQARTPVYFWGNLSGASRLEVSLNCVGTTAECTRQETKHLVEGRDWVQDLDGVFNGTSGIGQGTLANRPATCTTGVGYWATDQGSWNSSTSNPRGVNAGGADGVLYRCTATNTWSAYYTPYSYPHPLQDIGDGDIAPPIVTITGDNRTITSVPATVTGTASDAVGVSGCKYRIGAAPDGSNGTACTGTTSWSCSTTGYAQGANTLYVGCYDAAGNYGSDSIVVNLDSLAPTVSSRTIPSAGTTFAMVLSEPVQMAGAVPTLSASGGPVTLSGCVAATNTITCNTSRQVLGAETLTASYTQPGNGIEDLVGNDLVSFSSQVVTNSSSQIIVDLSALLPPTGTRYRKEVASTTIGVTSSKIAACRYGTAPGQPWANLGTYRTFDGITHTGTFEMAPGGGYQVCSRCFDTAAQQYSGDSCTRFSVRAIRKQPRW